MMFRGQMENLISYLLSHNLYGFSPNNRSPLLPLIPPFYTVHNVLEGQLI